jgi:hypothetical protein
VATQDYKNWVAAGRPFKLAQPIADYRETLLAAGWPGSKLGTIGDEEHLQAEVPQDHCPFSHTGWPIPNEYPYVLALDVTHDPDHGLNVGPLADYWIQQAKAGKTPWVKYINWEGLQWDVRRNWVPVTIGGHFDHAHLSVRTDWTHKDIGSFAVIGKGLTVTSTQTGRDVWAETINAVSENYAEPAGEFLKWALTGARTGERIEADVKALSDAVAALPGGGVGEATPQAIADALAANQGFIDALAAAIVGKTTEITLDERVRDIKALLTALGQGA